MKRSNWLLIIGVMAIVGSPLLCLAQAATPKKKVLFYSQSFGFWHGVVRRPMTYGLSHAEKAFLNMASEAGYEVLLCQDHNFLARPEWIKQYDAIVFYTSGNPPIHKEGFLKWLREGGALIGIHCATDTFHNWPEYVKAIGATFKTHGKQEDIVLKVENRDHPATAMLDKEWVIKDEIYQFVDGTFSRDNVKVLLSVNTEKSNLKAHKMKAGKDYPIAWTNTEGKGRIFYTALGHREDVWGNGTFRAHLLGGIAWALGQDKPAETK